MDQTKNENATLVAPLFPPAGPTAAPTVVPSGSPDEGEPPAVVSFGIRREEYVPTGFGAQPSFLRDVYLAWTFIARRAGRGRKVTNLTGQACFFRPGPKNATQDTYQRDSPVTIASTGYWRPWML